MAGIALVIWPRPKALSWQTLLNATYPVSIRPAGVTLNNGLFDVEAAPGSASRIVVRLADIASFGDIDGRGEPDAAVVLVSATGGTGTFVELAAVRNNAGSAEPVAVALLGDRVLVREVSVRDRSIFVRLRARGATDPLTLRTREISRRYELIGERLVMQVESEAEVQSAPADDFVYQPERIDLAVGSSRDVRGTLAPGRIASYVVRARAGQNLDLSATSEFENAVLSVFGLSDGVTLVSRRDYAVRRSLPLAVDQDYAVKVVNLAGHQLAFSLRVGLAVSPQPTSAPRPTSVPLPTRTPPTASPTVRPGIDERPLREAAEAAVAFASTRPPIFGVAVYQPERGVVYTQNADEQVPAASVVKVLVMLTVLEQARQEERPVTEADLTLLWPMITESDNDATSELWERIGRGQAVAALVRAAGVAGFTPDPRTSWGVSFVSARAMATILGKLIAGEILDDPSRALALKMLDGVVADQRWGVTAGTDPADRVGLKNGWYPGEEGWRVSSVGVVRPRSANAYAIAVMTGQRISWREGIDTIEGIAAPVNAALRR